MQSNGFRVLPEVVTELVLGPKRMFLRLVLEYWDVFMYSMKLHHKAGFVLQDRKEATLELR